jgi:hypothetical protein
MIRYKGFNIYSSHDSKNNHSWRVQSGYEFHGDYKTVGAAKSAITQKHSKVKS